jgi:hypothetical protein
MLIKSVDETHGIHPRTRRQLVAPIALYPDALVAQVLAASTFPDEIVEADRYVPMIPGSYTAHLLWLTRAGILCPESFLRALQSPSELDLESASSEDLTWAGIIGDMTGMAGQ